MSTQILVDFSLQFNLRAACKPSATASGPSPPFFCYHILVYIYTYINIKKM